MKEYWQNSESFLLLWIHTMEPTPKVSWIWTMMNWSFFVKENRLQNKHNWMCKYQSWKNKLPIRTFSWIKRRELLINWRASSNNRLEKRMNLKKQIKNYSLQSLNFLWRTVTQLKIICSKLTQGCKQREINSSLIVKTAK